MRGLYRRYLADRTDVLLSRRDHHHFAQLFEEVWANIQWDHRPSARRLWELAAHGPGDGDIVEIGSFLGNSTIFLSDGLGYSGRAGTVHAVDPHSEESMTQVPGDASISSQFIANVERYGRWDVVDYHRTTSVEAAAKWSGGPIRLLYIDGLHTFDAVIADYEAWSPHLSEQHVVVFDDFLWPAVEAAVRTLRDTVKPVKFSVRGGQAVFSTDALPLSQAGLP